MLLGIPTVISPDLLKVLAEMGHGDEILLADANFPAASHANRLIRADGHGIVPLLTAILTLLPLDAYVDHPATLMQVLPGDPVHTPIWNEYASVLSRAGAGTEPFESVERFAFYQRAREAYAVVATGETALYANIMLRKGVVKES